MKIDMHIHTRYSKDALITVDDLVDVYMETGIVVAVTDHNTTDAWEHVRMKGIPFIPGEEIDTGEGEVIGLFLNECIPKGLGFNETVDRIREQGGLVYCPHPFDRFRKCVCDEERIARCDIVEVFNSRCLLQRFNDQALSVAERFNLLKGVGSDAHFRFEIGTSYLTVVDDAIVSPKNFIRALSDHPEFHTSKTTVMVHGLTKTVSFIRNLKSLLSRKPPEKT